MNWIEVTVRGIDGEGVEAVWEVMNRYGHGGAVIEDVRATSDSTGYVTEPLAVKAYLPDDEEGAAAAQRLREALWHLSIILPMPEPEVRSLAAQDWSEAWKQHYHRTRIGQRLVIAPAWEDEAPEGSEDVVVRLDPGMAFGTGTHPSTQLCLELLERWLQPGQRVYDVGTGSGVLAIAAAKLGAGEVVAVDIDRVAEQALAENAALNGLEGRIPMQVGSVELFAGPFDLILINILAEIIVTLLPAAIERLAPTGTFILAGIIASREPLVVEALEAAGFTVAERLMQKDWVGLAARRQEG